MATILISFVVLAIVMVGMAVGVIFQGKPIKGSCGGMSALGMDTACDICGGDTKKCEEETQRKQNEAQKSLGYDATKHNG